MLFSSSQYLLFLPAVVVVFFAMPHRFRWVLLLAVSYCFYASWKVAYLPVIMLSTLASFVCALLMERSHSMLQRRVWLSLGLLCNLAILFFFKYLAVSEFQSFLTPLAA